jgi:hypothetical protein
VITNSKNQEDFFTILLLNKESEEDEEEKWTFSYKYYSFNYQEIENTNLINVYNNLGELVKTFSNILLKN